MSLSRDYTRYALRTLEFSDAAVAAARTFLLDSLGVGIAGSRAPFREAVHATATRWGQGEGARVFGTGEAMPPATAAFLNGFQIHSMEYDCVHEAAVVHPMATVLAALSAEAMREDVGGRDFLHALIVAVDVACELGVAVRSPLKFFRPATAGLFGATLGIARLRGFDEATALSAMGCALAQCAGVMQAHVEGKPTLPVQIAGAARAAMVACDLAEAELAGPEHALEGPFGYFAMFEDDADMEARPGGVHRIREVSWKPFPTGRAAQGGIVLAQELRKKGMTEDNVAALTLRAPPIIPRLVARKAYAGMSPNYARLCFPWLAALTLRHGSVELAHFTREALDDPDLLALAARVEVVDDGNPDPAAFVPQTLSATLQDGSEVSATTERLFGSPEFPLTDEQHMAKLRGCLAFAYPELSENKVAARARAMREAVDALEGNPASTLWPHLNTPRMDPA